MNYLKKLILILAVGVLFTGCEPKAEGDLRFTEILAYDAPSIKPLGGRVETLEEDKYGRILFSYGVDEKRNYFIGICQAIDGNELSFYQDQSLIWDAQGVTEGYDFSKEEITALKERNDWGKPLNPEKISIIDIKEGHESAFNWNEMIEKYELGNKIDAFYAAADPGTGKQLYYIIAEKGGERSLYFYILDDDFSFNEETGLEKMDDRYYFQPQLHEFKVKNGWGF